MKKHQKVLLGIMALSLAGGTGTAIALNFTGANSESVSNGTDEAIYLYWGDEKQNTAVKAEVNNLVANETQYRCLVVAPKSSKDLTGWVKLTFELAATDSSGIASSADKSYALPGLTVTIYETSKCEFDGTSYSASSRKAGDQKGTALTTTSSSVGETSFGFEVNTENSASIDDSSMFKTNTHYYTIEFVWDGEGVDADNEIFGGTLNITQEFTTTDPNTIEG